jgi:hemerythrin-like domain-containing protein
MACRVVRRPRNEAHVKPNDVSEGPRDPFEQLERSHRRLEERLEDLRWAAREARGAAADVDALRDVAAFFARAVRRHEDDEESSLFPRLHGNAEVAPLLERLAAEHREHVALHARLDAIIPILDRTPDDAAAIADLGEVAEALVSAYRSHVDAEERTLFPAARAALDATALAEIAREMQARRGGGGGGGGGGRGGGRGGARQ